MNGQPPPILFVILFPVFFVGMWLLVNFILAHVSGWAALAERFAAPGGEPPAGRKFSAQSGMIGVVNFNGCLTVIAASEGLYLSVWRVFRFKKPPLFIPWRDMHSIGYHQILWVEMISFEVGNPKIATIKLRKKVFGGLPQFEAAPATK